MPTYVHEFTKWIDGLPCKSKQIGQAKLKIYVKPLLHAFVQIPKNICKKKKKHRNEQVTYCNTSDFVSA